VASPKKSALFRLRWLLLAPIPLAWCVVAHFGGLGFLENKFLDWRFRYRGTISAPVKIVYVDVDSQSLSEIGGFPWSRMYFARVAKALVDAGGARAVGIDFVLSSEGMSESIDWKKHVHGNIELAKYLYPQGGFDAPPVALAAAYAGWRFRDINHKLTQRTLPIMRRETRPISAIEAPEVPEFELSFDPNHTKLINPPNVGLIDTIDGGTRFVPAFAPTLVRTYPHMAIELARLYWGLPNDAVRIGPDRIDFLKADGSRQASVPLIDGQIIEVNWFSPWVSPVNPRIGFSTVFTFEELMNSADPVEKKSGQDFFAQGEFKDAVVLIGPVDPLLQDLAPTPLDELPVPKVGVHGNLLKTIVSGLYLVRLSEVNQYAIVICLSALIAGLSVVGGGRAVPAKIGAVAAAAGYAALAFQLFKTSHLILPMAAPLGAAFTTCFAAIAWQVVEEQKTKSRIKGMFGTYVSPALVDQMVDSDEEPKLGGVVEHITAYFSDIERFSSMSEVLSPSLLVELMNEYLTACTDILQEEGGTLDKYIGDAVIMIFGAPLALPGHAHKACLGALRVQKRIGELRAKWAGEEGKWPDLIHRLQARVGLNTGPAVVGNMGSNTRFSYTMMSDDVNIAARMESGAKAWGVYTMCTEATRGECEKVEAGRVVFRALGRIVVQGRAHPIPIFELLALREDATGPMRECISLFEQGLARYHARDWRGAIDLFLRSEPLEVNGPGRTTEAKTNPSLVYMAIAEGYRSAPPPADWDGVFHMKEK
jgi:adenylate cyclase